MVEGGGARLALYHLKSPNPIYNHNSPSGYAIVLGGFTASKDKPYFKANTRPVAIDMNSKRDWKRTFLRETLCVIGCS